MVLTEVEKVMATAIGVIEIMVKACIGCDEDYVGQAVVWVRLAGHFSCPFQTLYLCAWCLVTYSSGLGNQGQHHWRTSFFMMLLEYGVLSFRVKA